MVLTETPSLLLEDIVESKMRQVLSDFSEIPKDLALSQTLVKDFSLFLESLNRNSIFSLEIKQLLSKLISRVNHFAISFLSNYNESKKNGKIQVLLQRI